jgi:hypothetical protein
MYDIQEMNVEQMNKLNGGLLLGITLLIAVTATVVIGSARVAKLIVDYKKEH